MNFDEAHRDDLTTRLFVGMVSKYPDSDPVELAQKARAAADALMAELDKPRGDEA